MRVEEGACAWVEARTWAARSSVLVLWLPPRPNEYISLRVMTAGCLARNDESGGRRGGHSPQVRTSQGRQEQRGWKAGAAFSLCVMTCAKEPDSDWCIALWLDEDSPNEATKNFGDRGPLVGGSPHGIKHDFVCVLLGLGAVNAQPSPAARRSAPRHAPGSCEAKDEVTLCPFPGRAMLRERSWKAKSWKTRARSSPRRHPAVLTAVAAPLSQEESIFSAESQILNVGMSG